MSDLATNTVRLGLSEEEILALPAAVDVLTAGRAFGYGRDLTYQLLKQGRFPVKVLPAGPRSRRCLRSDLLEALRIERGHREQATR